MELLIAVCFKFYCLGQVKGVTTKRSTVRSPASSAVSVSSLSSMSSASKRVPGKVRINCFTHHYCDHVTPLFYEGFV